MTEIIITKLVDIRELEGFTCGIPEIDQVVKEDLPESFRDKVSDIYVARLTETGFVCAVFSLSKGRIELDSDDFCEMHGIYTDVPEDEFRRATFPAIDLDLLAVDQRHQHCHIGETIINEIFERYMEFGFRDELFIAVDAYFKPGYSAIYFYEKCGFYSTGKINGGDTILMYRPLVEIEGI